LLESLQSYFKVGSITKFGNFALLYRVSSLKDLSVIINHFDKNILLTQKQADYLLFKQAFDIMKSKAHLTEEGFNKILSIRSSINKGLSEELKEVYPNIVAIEKPLVKDQTITPEWFAGFTSGEGSFSVNIYKNPKKTGFKTSLRFTIVQHVRDKGLLESFIKFFNCGIVNSHSSPNASRYVISKFSDIYEKTIPFFKEHPVLGIKSLDFACWSEVAEIIKTKEHLTEEGIKKIMKIKANMNKNRVIDTSADLTFEITDDSDAFDFANNS